MAAPSFDSHAFTRRLLVPKTANALLAVDGGCRFALRGLLFALALPESLHHAVHLVEALTVDRLGAAGPFGRPTVGVGAAHVGGVDELEGLIAEFFAFFGAELRTRNEGCRRTGKNGKRQFGQSNLHRGL